MPDKSDVLVAVAPITEKPGIDRAMRMAIQRVPESLHLIDLARKRGEQVPDALLRASVDFDLPPLGDAPPSIIATTIRTGHEEPTP
jgi:hypothetical protein